MVRGRITPLFKATVNEKCHFPRKTIGFGREKKTGLAARGQKEHKDFGRKGTDSN